MRGWPEDYHSHLQTFPVVTKSATAAAVALLGDVLAQAVFEEHDVLDLFRSFTVALEGAFVSGPLLHYAYEWLDDLHVAEIDWLDTILQVLVDIFVMDSIFTATLMVTSGLLQGQSWRCLLYHELRDSYWMAVQVSWSASLGMAPLQCINFAFLPVEYRVLMTNLQDVVWNAAVSYMAHRGRVNKTT